MSAIQVRPLTDAELNQIEGARTIVDLPRLGLIHALVAEVRMHRERETIGRARTVSSAVTEGAFIPLSGTMTESELGCLEQLLDGLEALYRKRVSHPDNPTIASCIGTLWRLLSPAPSPPIELDLDPIEVEEIKVPGLVSIRTPKDLGGD